MTPYTYKNEELILHGLDIPAQWQATLACARGFSLVNAFGQGYGIDREPAINNYLGPRRYFYLRDNGSGASFCPTVVPMLSGVRDYEVRMHPARMSFSAQSEGGISVKTRVTVDPEFGCEVWEFAVTNNTGDARALSLFAVIPFPPRRGFGALGGQDNATGAVVKRATSFYVSLDEYEKIKDEKSLAYLVADRRPADFCANLRKIIPRDEEANSPAFLADGIMGGHEVMAGESCGAMRLDLALAAGETQTLRLAVGIASELSQVAEVQQRLATDAAFVSAEELWQHWSAAFHAELPDENLTRFLNTFAKHQTRMNCVTARWSQAPATRNWLQDWQGAAYLVPQEAKAALLQALAAQRADGFLPQGFTTSSHGKLVDALGKDFRDAPTWAPPFALTLLEVGIAPEFLQQQLPFIDGGSATVLEHLYRGIKFLAEHRGQHGLVLFGEGDWNDQLNFVGPRGVGESGWLSFAFVHACRTLAAVSEWGEVPEIAREVNSWADEVTAALNEHAWDGQWYLRGFTDDGQPFGSAADEEGRIFLEPQVWGPISAAVPAERLKTVLESIKRELLTPYGPALLAPAFRRFHPELGRISSDLPGNKENGSAYCHATMFYAKALFCAGKPAEAVAALTSVLPTNPANPVEYNGQNPAYLPNCYIGPDAGPQFAGHGSNHNWTGTAPWMIMLCLHDLLGVTGTPDGIQIRPNFPPDWQQASLTINIQGATLHLNYTRGSNPGVYQNGQRLPDELLRNPVAGAVYVLEVVV